MKRFTAIVIVMLAAFCTANRLQAQSQEVRVHVPFSFIVGSKQLPAGSYQFLAQLDSTIIIRNRDQPIAVLSRIVAANGAPPDASRLVFNKYGDRYFLSEIRCASAALNVELPRSKLEKQAQTEHASLESSRVLLAAN